MYYYFNAGTTDQSDDWKTFSFENAKRLFTDEVINTPIEERGGLLFSKHPYKYIFIKGLRNILKLFRVKYTVLQKLDSYASIGVQHFWWRESEKCIINSNGVPV